MNFYADVICKSPLFHTLQTVTTLDLLEPVTRAAVQAIVADAKAMGKDLRVGETYRSKERQAQLFQKHATTLKNVGVHHYGLACDFHLFERGIYIGAAPKYGFLRPLAEKHGLISGQDWGLPKIKHTFTDADHVQRVTMARQRKLFAGQWYPDSGYAVLADLGRAGQPQIA